MAAAVLVSMPFRSARLSASPVIFHRLEFSQSTKFNATDRTFAPGMGLRLSTAHLTLCGAISHPATDLGPQAFRPLELQYNYGLQLQLPLAKKRASLSIQAGTLQFSHAWSRFRSPSLTSPSPLQNSISKDTGAFSALPGLTSSAAPFAAALLLSPSSTADKLIPQAQILWSSQGHLLLSTGLSFALSPGAKLAASLTGALFTVTNEPDTTWQQKELPYPPTKIPAASLDLSLSTTCFKGIMYTAVTGTPHGGAAFWARSRNSLNIGNASLYLAAFAGTPWLTTASGTTLTTPLQIQANPQYTWILSTSSIRAGLLYQQQHKIPCTQGQSPYNSFSTKGECSWTSPRHKASDSAGASWTDTDKKYGFNAKIFYK